MKRTLKSLLLAVSCLTVGGSALYATCTTTPGDTCGLPGATTQTTIAISAANITKLECVNSQGSGNPTTSNYFFAVTTTDMGSTTASISNSGNGSAVVGVQPTHPNSSSPSSIVTVGSVNGTKGGTTYWIYAQACPAGTAAGGTNCSEWAKVDASQVTTTAYETSVFNSPTAGTDASVNTIAVRTNIPSLDQGSVSAIDLTIDDLINSSNDQTINPIGYSGDATPYTIDNTEFTNGFKPNNKYQYSGQVQYPWDLVPTAGPQTVGPFWTTPENPGTVSASAVTHCSALITAHNSNASTPNPTYTEYSLCAGGVCQTSGRINGTPSPSDTVSVTLTGLTPNTGYTPGATALVGDQDSSQTGWNNSGQTTGSGFTTLDWGGIFSVGTITTTSAVFSISGLTGAGSIASWVINLNGSPVLSGSGDPTGNHTLSPLIPNTSYNVTIQLTETSGCSTTLPVGGVGFYTLPVAPTAGSFGAKTASTIVVNWTDASTNDPATTYHLQYSSNGGSTWTDFGTNPSKVAGSAQSTTLTGLSPLTTYDVRVKTVSESGNSANDSAYFQIPGSAETLDTSINLSGIGFTVYPSSISLNVSVTSGGIAPYTYTWSVTPTGGTSFSAANGTTSGNALYMFYTTITNYNVCVQVEDNNGSGPGSANECQSINPGQVPTTMEAIQDPNGATVVVNNTLPFNVVVLDQFNQPIPNQGVSWTLNNGAATNAPVSNSSFTIVTGVNSTLSPVTLTASLNGLTQNISITVLASGAQFTTSPTISLNANQKTANLSAAGSDNSPGAGTLVYNWTLESGPGAITVTPNDVASANNAALTFSKAGTYVIRCTISDNFGSNFEDTASTTVVQVLSGLTVCPNGFSGCPTSITIQTFVNQTFTVSGLDQFGAGMSAGNVTWTSSDSRISAAGAYSSPDLGSNVLVQAHVGNVASRAIDVNVISYDVSGAYAYPVPYKASMSPHAVTFTSLGSDAKIRIYTTSGHLVFNTEITAGTYNWPIKNNSGENVASGVYFYVIESPQAKKDGKLIIIQ